MKRKTTVLFLSFIALVNAYIDFEIDNPYPAIDYDLHEQVLDADKCAEHMSLLRENTPLLWMFYDAGFRLPRGKAVGNFRDMGNYHQCLNIDISSVTPEGESIQGKYCRINVPLDQNITLPLRAESPFDMTAFNAAISVNNETFAKMKEFNLQQSEIRKLLGMHTDRIPAKRDAISPALAMFSMDLAICIPRVCSTQQAMNSLIFNVSSIVFTYDDIYCRLPDDKKWSPADTVATTIFSIIALITVISTGYDLVNTFLYKNDPKHGNPLFTSFSVYTNGRRLNTFSSGPGMLHCVDGIRALAMMWVVVGHSFSTEVAIANPISFFSFGQSIKSAWVTAANYTVDTFFCLGGVVLVYTTAGKMTQGQLLKNLHFFYLNRLLRLWPIFAFAMLLQASYLNSVYDGPDWNAVEDQTNFCRTTWWLNLVFVHTYINSNSMCLSHSWYLAIDFHCYLVSPLILFWVLGRSRKAAWIALTCALLAILVGATTYNFIMDFKSVFLQFNREDRPDYVKYYYVNTLTRASPFFVGMIGGYVLHLLRGRTFNISWITAGLLWIVAGSTSTAIFFYPYIISGNDYYQPFVDGFMNSFMRPAWGAAICWMIIACTHGYGGPVNWFLSLEMWRLPARLAYAIYLLHYPLMMVVNGAVGLAPSYFTVDAFTFKFLAHFALTFVVSYLATIVIDAPCSTLIKLMLEGNKKKSVQTREAATPTKELADPTQYNGDTDNNKVVPIKMIT